MQGLLLLALGSFSPGLHRPRVLPLLRLWIDSTPREGPENMAVDEWLADTSDQPVLRSYRWRPGWGSFGYFVKTGDLPSGGLKWVRRWTGGGIVDHRADWTYTLFVPRGSALAEAKGAESYRAIHGALVVALASAGITARLSGSMPPAAGGECFTQPVEHDLLDAAGRKIAGAGQRRTARGLLHQGSVAAPCRPESVLAEGLAETVRHWCGEPDPRWLEARIGSRYGLDSWTRRR